MYLFVTGKTKGRGKNFLDFTKKWKEELPTFSQLDRERGKLRKGREKSLQFK